MRSECHEQALGTLTTSTLDALCDPLRMQSRAPEAEAIITIDIRVMMSNDANIFGCPFVVRCSDCLRDGID